MKMQGDVRRFYSSGKLGLSNAGQPFSLCTLGEQGVSLIMPEKGMRAQANIRYNAVTGNGSTFIAPVTAYPTTTATFLLFNGEEPGGKSYFVDTAYAFLASGTNAAGGALLGAVTLSRQHNAGVLPAAYANTVVSSLSGQKLNTRAVLANA